MDETKAAFFILYRNGQANLVDQNVWERNWHEWWKSLQPKSQEDDTKKKRKY